MAEQQKRISLCMIVKNEEKYLSGCLDSVQGIADEIIIVDTGSTDETIAIAERYGAIVIRSEWEHDFAKARNRGVERASGEWILFLDADEQLDEATKPQLLEYVRHADLSALLLQIRNQIGPENDQGSTIHPVLRMFRNDFGHRFEGRIHEQISFSILRRNPSARFHLTDVIIHHYGYRTQVVAEKNKLQRNMELLELALAEEPDNTFHRYNIGVEYLRNNRAADALEAFRIAKRSAGFKQLSYAHLVFKYESLSLQLLGRWEEAGAAAREGVAIFPDYTKAAMRELINQDEYDTVSFRMYDFWDSVTHYREDEWWNLHQRQTMTLARYLPGYHYAYPKRAHHAPRLPFTYSALPGHDTDLRIKHFGWAGSSEERQAKYDRYMKLDPLGQWGSLAHYASILDPNPKLIRWQERERQDE
jgi:glycosyltransferase involved in cell wall biosynthesis